MEGFEDEGVGGGGLVPLAVVALDAGGAGEGSRLFLKPPSPIELRLRLRKLEAVRRTLFPLSSRVAAVEGPAAEAATARDFLSIVLSRGLRLGRLDREREDLERAG